MYRYHAIIWPRNHNYKVANLRTSVQKLPWPALGSAIDLPWSSESDKTFEFAARCLKECSASPRHKLCHPQRRVFRPTRLLQITEPGKPIKLQEKWFFSSFVDYIALSHCWGKKVSITTTKETKRQRLRSIDWDDLPPLFQDTIVIAHRLGVKYIWIDALCILQDDKADWEQEASQMASVYADAYATVAAVQAIDSNQRCLGDRIKPVKLIYKNTKGDPFVLKVRQISDHHPMVSDRRPAEIEGPLVERAWALQEHVLCSRVLHYTSSELIFECRNMYSCECTPTFKHTSVTTPALLSMPGEATDRKRQFATWHRLVEKYSLRKLTRGSDKLPAISGMALKIQSMVDSRYLAGLWKDNLLEDLLWSSGPDLESPSLAPRLSEYRAPTWSWASVDIQIRYENDISSSSDKGRIISEVIDADCEAINTNYPLGEVRSGHINLCGPVKMGTLVAPSNPDFYYKLRFDGPSAADVFPDSLLVVDAFDQDTKISSRVRRAKLGEVYNPFKEQVICIGVKDYMSEGIMTGLVLANMHARDENVFERVGLFSCGREVFGLAQKQKIRLV
jgi:Heterokaryon incompatibility protein (HET)